MGAQQEQAEGLGIVALKHLLDGHKVTKAFAHFFAVHIQEPCVAPDTRELPAKGTFALGDLVLVVREHQVHAARVDIELCAQVRVGHGGALDVPTGAALAPGTLEAPLALAAPLPKCEVGSLLFEFTDLHARALFELIELAAGQLAVVGKGAHTKVHIAPLGRFGRVRLALGDELFDDAHDVAYALGDFGLCVGKAAAHACELRAADTVHTRAQLQGRFSELCRAFDNLVVHISHVAYEGNTQAARAHVAHQHIEAHICAGMAGVGMIVGGEPTQVHTHVARFERREDFGGTGEGVVEAYGHGKGDPTPKFGEGPKWRVIL